MRHLLRDGGELGSHQPAGDIHAAPHCRRELKQRGRLRRTERDGTVSVPAVRPQRHPEHPLDIRVAGGDVHGVSANVVDRSAAGKLTAAEPSRNSLLAGAQVAVQQQERRGIVGTTIQLF